MIKILYTIPNFDTAGSGKALLKIATRLDPERFESHICCMHDRGAFFKVVRASGIPVHLFPYTADMSRRLRGLVHVVRTARFFRQIRPDIIHSFHYAPDYSEALATLLAGVKWVYTKKNMNWGGASRNGWWLRSWMAHGIVAQNTDMLRDFFPGWKKVKLIPRGVDLDEFRPNGEMVYPLPREYRWIVCVANLVPVKGVETLLEAFHRVADQYPDWRLAIVGDDRSDYAAQLKMTFAELVQTQQAVFTGKVLNVKDYLRQADLFVLPTLNKGRKEGSPVSLLEAMATGLPVLASAVPGIRDQLAHFPELLFEAGNVEVLTKKLATWLERDDATRRRMGQALRREAEARFSIEREVRDHEEFYLSL